MSYEDSDQPVYFRQRRYFYYLTGLNFPDCVVTYNIQRDSLYIWIPPPNTGRSVIYNGEGTTQDQIRAVSDFDGVSKISYIQDYLTYFAHHEEGKIYVLHDYQQPKIPKTIHYKDGSRTNLESIPFDTTSLKRAMDAARAIKSPYEIRATRKANAITTKAHLNVLKGLKTFKNECEIEAIFAGTCIALQAKSQAYGIIAGSGVNASTLHYDANNESLEGRQLVVLDAGCEWKCYASDVTRTFPISGQWTSQAKSIYDIVEQMQEECIAMVKPGANYRDIHMHAHAVAVKGLLKLGLLQNADFEELYLSGVSLAFFPHGLGREFPPPKSKCKDQG
jgi:Xaa-Pro dipeptidase